MREASDRQTAVTIGQLLVDTDYIHHVVDEHNFEDGFLFFRFRQDGKFIFPYHYTNVCHSNY